MLSLYRKYRPSRVSDLDHTQAREFFAGVMSSGRFAHAYLFSGPRGTGKTSSARILARLLNCKKNRRVVTDQKGAFVEPCGVCEVCRSIESQASLAVVEIDAASNRGIDDIRELRQRIGLAPAEGVITVYIVDEVHMLTVEAFNALLKTLEEPPPHVLFVLCTTEPQKLPATIVSRCTVLQFNKAGHEEVLRSLQRVVTAENIDASEDALAFLASRADGSFRDALKLIEQLSQAKGTITRKSVEDLVAHGVEDQSQAMVGTLLANDLHQALFILETIEREGVNPSVFGVRVLELLRERLLAGVKSGEAKETSRLVELITVFSSAVAAIKQAVIPLLPLEVAVVDYFSQTKKENSQSRVATERKDTPDTHPRARVMPHKDTVKKSIHEAPTAKVLEKGALSLHIIEDQWKELMLQVKPHNHSLEALLRACRPLHFKENWITLEVFYKFHKEQLEQERHRQVLERVFSEVLNQPVKLKFTLGKKPVVQGSAKSVATEIENVSSNVDDEDLATAAEEIFGN